MYFFEKCKQSAENGSDVAQYYLARMYNCGENIPQNNKEAIKWYQRAADQGHAEAQYQLGWMYDDGAGVPQDPKEAAKWYRQAAEQGHYISQYSLAQAEIKDQDYIEAWKWLDIAAQKNFMAFFDRNELETKMSPEQLQAIKA